MSLKFDETKSNEYEKKAKDRVELAEEYTDEVFKIVQKELKRLMPNITAAELEYVRKRVGLQITNPDITDADLDNISGNVVEVVQLELSERSLKNLTKFAKEENEKIGHLRHVVESELREVKPNLTDDEISSMVSRLGLWTEYPDADIAEIKARFDEEISRCKKH